MGQRAAETEEFPAKLQRLRREIDGRIKLESEKDTMSERPAEVGAISLELRRLDQAIDEALAVIGDCDCRLEPVLRPEMKMSDQPPNASEKAAHTSEVAAALCRMADMLTGGIGDLKAILERCEV